ncbi:MAG: DUF6706 family protein [Myroides sp.]
MTIGEYIKEKTSLWSVELSDEVITLELSRVELDSSVTISAETNLDKFFYNVIPDIILLPKSVSEGGFSISYDKDAITAYYKILASRLGLPNLLAKDTITDITNRW